MWSRSTFHYLNKNLLKYQESCVINERKPTRYFQLETGTCQGDPISTFLIILAL